MVPFAPVTRIDHHPSRLATVALPDQTGASPSRRSVLLGGAGLAGGVALRDPDATLWGREAPRDTGTRQVSTGRPAATLAGMLGVCLKTSRRDGVFGEHAALREALLELGVTWNSRQTHGSTT